MDREGRSIELDEFGSTYLLPGICTNCEWTGDVTVPKGLAIAREAPFPEGILCTNCGCATLQRPGKPGVQQPTVVVRGVDPAVANLEALMEDYRAEQERASAPWRRGGPYQHESWRLLSQDGANNGGVIANAWGAWPANAGSPAAIQAALDAAQQARDRATQEGRTLIAGEGSGTAGGPTSHSVSTLGYIARPPQPVDGGVSYTHQPQAVSPVSLAQVDDALARRGWAPGVARHHRAGADTVDLDMELSLRLSRLNDQTMAIVRELRGNSLASEPIVRNDTHAGTPTADVSGPTK